MTIPVRPPSDWIPVGRTSNSHYFRAGEDVLVVLPDLGLKDTGPAARENVAFQLEFARRAGHPCAVVVHLASLLSQDTEARRAYAEGMDPALIFAAGLVATNPISRAIASFFLGLTRPRFPTRVFDGFEAAIAWVATVRPIGTRR